MTGLGLGEGVDSIVRAIEYSLCSSGRYKETAADVLDLVAAAGSMIDCQFATGPAIAVAAVEYLAAVVVAVAVVLDWERLAGSTVVQMLVGSTTALAAVRVAVYVSVASEVRNSVDLGLAVLVERLRVEMVVVFARQEWSYPAVGCLLASDTNQVSGTFAGCGRGICWYKCSSNVLQNVF